MLRGRQEPHVGERVLHAVPRPLAEAVGDGVSPPQGLRARRVLSREPGRVVRGRAYKTKDGEPLELFAYAEGFAGPFAWLEEHLSDIDALSLIIKLQNRHWVDDDINKMLESMFNYFD